MGRTMVVWLLCSGLPNTGIALTALFENTFWGLENDEYIISVLILWTPVMVFGFSNCTTSAGGWLVTNLVEPTISMNTTAT